MSSLWSQLSEWTWSGSVNFIETYRLPNNWEGKEQKQSNPAVFAPQSNLEHAGTTYETLLRTTYKNDIIEEVKQDVKVDDKVEEVAETKKGGKKNKKGGAKDVGGVSALGEINLKDEKWARLTRVDQDLGDYYGLLGLSAESLDATEEDIRKAWRVVSLVCHPDKAKPEERDQAEARFQAQQKAFDTLIDLQKRRAYDSTLEFDDSIPNDSASHSNPDVFYKLYAPVFRRNERFSVIKPCPKLGDAKTPIDDVHHFYDFWLSFKSWRDFQYLNEHNINDGTSREEKRWMLRENEKKQAAKKKEEVARVRKFVENAMKRDPRIIAYNAEQEAEKLRRKNAKKDAIKAQQDALEKARLEEEARLAEEKKKQDAEKEASKDAKQLLKKSRQYFKKACIGAGFSEDEVEKLKPELSLEDLNKVTDIFKSNPTSEEGKQLFRAHMTRIFASEVTKQQEIQENLAQQRLAKKLEEEKKAETDSKGWSDEEMALLTKGLVKFPVGTVKRWEKITEMICAKTNRTTKEVIQKAKHVELQHTVDKDEAFKKYQEKMNKDKESQELSKVKNMTVEAAAQAQEEHKRRLEIIKQEEALASQKKREEAIAKQKMEAEIAAREEEEAKEAAAAEEAARAKAQAEEDAKKAAATQRAKEEAAKAKAKEAAANAESQKKQAQAAKEAAAKEAEAKKQEEIKKQAAIIAKQNADKAAAAAAQQSKKATESAAAQNKKKESAPVEVKESKPTTTTTTQAYNEGEWKAEEQAALEKALKTVSKDASDRWEQIAAIVGTRSKKQCVARFKEIREAILKSQGK